MSRKDYFRYEVVKWILWLAIVFLVSMVLTVRCQAQLTRQPVVLNPTNGAILVGANLFTGNSNLLNASVLTNDFYWRTNPASGGISNLPGPVLINGVLTSTNINGTVGSFTNGGFLNPVFTNAINYGNAFSSPGGGAFSEQYGQGASAPAAGSTAIGRVAQAQGSGSTAVGIGSTTTNLADSAFGNSSIAAGGHATAIGASAVANATNATAIGYNAVSTNSNATAIGSGATTTASNQVMLGNSALGIDTWISRNLTVQGSIQGTTHTGTNTFNAGDIAFSRYALSSLANGNNAAIVVGTNVFVEISGPSSAFTLNGIAGGRDGKFLFLIYQGGQAWTIANESGVDPTAANRIRTGTGADLNIPNNPGWAMLIYSGSASRWLLFTPAQTDLASGANLATANIGTLTLTNQLASTNISHVFVRTNFISGQLYTNLYGGPIEVSANATLAVAAVSGNAVLSLEASGNATNQVGISTLVTSIAMSYTNYIAAVITNNGTYTFTNRSSGAGNSSTVVGGQIIVY